jgi:hypothetical protein
MSRPLRWIFLLVLAAGLAFASRASAVAPEIRDDGRFFSPEAVKKANEQIRDIFAKYGKDVLIETFASVPPDQLQKVQGMSTREKEEYFRKQAIDRAKQRVVNGLYILINKEPKYVYVAIAPQARAQFDGDTSNRIRETLLSNWDIRIDEGLAGVLKTIHERLAKVSSPR